MNQTPGIAQLLRKEYAGDWHDKPLRYVVIIGSFENPLTQKFSTVKDARTWAGCVRRSDGDYKTASDLFTATWNK